MANCAINFIWKVMADTAASIFSRSSLFMLLVNSLVNTYNSPGPNDIQPLTAATTSPTWLETLCGEIFDRSSSTMHMPCTCFTRCNCHVDSCDYRDILRPTFHKVVFQYVAKEERSSTTPNSLNLSHRKETRQY
ncbi:hypothetical protein SESBI_35672 [Sesbania bispinosa]|nr:hypothetical protein SESBI_35672 [Sesbania bispinosa]